MAPLAAIVQVADLAAAAAAAVRHSRPRSLAVCSKDMHRLLTVCSRDMHRNVAFAVARLPRARAGLRRRDPQPCMGRESQNIVNPGGAGRGGAGRPAAPSLQCLTSSQRTGACAVPSRTAARKDCDCASQLPHCRHPSWVIWVVATQAWAVWAAAAWVVWAAWAACRPEPCPEWAACRVPASRTRRRRQPGPPGPSTLSLACAP